MKLSKLLIAALQLSFICAEAYKGRKHATAHFSQNGTIYILGGTEAVKADQFASPLLTLQFESPHLLHPSASKSSILPSIGHTSHLVNNTILTLFGLHPTKHTQSPPGPTPRYHHTSLLIDSQLYLFGGLSVETHQPVSEAYVYSNRVWTQIGSNHTRWGHVSFTYRHWIISCFGRQIASLSNHCEWFDTLTSSTQSIEINSPPPRVFATMTSINGSRYILFGGEREDSILDDLWQLDLSPFEMSWTQLTSSHHARSGHTGLVIDDLILYYGGQETAKTLATEPLYMNITTGRWLEQTRFLHQLDVKLTSQAGTIGGVIGGIAALLIVVLVLFWMRRKRKQAVHSKSRAARFSKPMTYAEKTQVTDSILIDVKPFLSLPELASTHQPKRISAISLGAEFKFSVEDHPGKESAITSKKSNNNLNGLKRLTLNLFSNNEPRKMEPSQTVSTRASIGQRSVASVQWVGFSDSMDYNRWRDNSNSSLHLAVKNAGCRASSYYTNESVQSTPKSPMFPHHLRDSVIVHYLQDDSTKHIVEKRFANA